MDNVNKLIKPFNIKLIIITKNKNISDSIENNIKSLITFNLIIFFSQPKIISDSYFLLLFFIIDI